MTDDRMALIELIEKFQDFLSTCVRPCDDHRILYGLVCLLRCHSTTLRSGRTKDRLQVFDGTMLRSIDLETVGLRQHTSPIAVPVFCTRCIL